jgi:DNA-binding NarL/FixJ family response regulator
MMMPKKLKLALIVAQPSPLRDALRALVTTMPQVEVVAETGSSAALAEMHNKFQLDLVLLDAGVQDEDVWQALAMVKRECPHTKGCVLVEGDEQKRKAEAAGADLVLYKGFPAADLAKILEGLLAQISNED